LHNLSPCVRHRELAATRKLCKLCLTQLIEHAEVTQLIEHACPRSRTRGQIAAARKLYKLCLTQLIEHADALDRAHWSRGAAHRRGRGQARPELDVAA
jgi:hypothetical protein